MKWLIQKIFGTAHERTMKKLRPLVTAINELEPKIKRLSDQQLKAKTQEFKERLKNGATLDDLLIEAFAVVREASVRTLGMRHFDVQLVGGIVLHQGKIAEMKTGEGKTLVATLPLYLNALEGKGVHLVTVNDYLAKRDAEWMGKIYNFLGMSVGVIEHGQTTSEKKKAYNCDITYGQNNEFGFDYLRDNLKFSVYEMVQRELNYAIIDEADSILIDEARTPLIISGPAEESTELYRVVNSIIPFLRRDIHFTVDEKAHSVTLTEEGVDLVEKKLGITNLYDPNNIEYLHHVLIALKAHTLYKRDVHYHVNENGEIIIIDEFTGRLMPGRRWSDGLHQAIEAKEGVKIQEENKTLATISFQNLFRLYKKLAGMTGTAETEAQEFMKIYNLEVVVIPTHKPCIRTDHDDVIFKTYKEKRKAIVDEIERCYKRGQPVLVGTTSVEKSEDISRMLTKRGIPHNVLNAKHHEREAYIIAQAGRIGAVTVATNMAGRGTDILLGGNPEMLAKSKVIEEEDPSKFEEYYKKFKEICDREHEEVVKLGGLHVIGTERHESRRIDNQLRGRSGRQGDPGSSRFYISLEDDLMRIFGGERITTLMDKVGMEEGQPLTHPWLTKAVERAQKRVEAHHFEIRKNLKEFDDVMDYQRKTIYALRRQILEGRYKPLSVTNEGEKHKNSSQGSEYIPIDPIFQERVRWLIRGLLINYSELKKREKEEEIVLYPGFDIIQRLHTKKLEYAIYNHFGVRIPIDEYEEDPEGAFNKLTKEVARSLSEQRERLFDLVENIINELIETYCGGKEGGEGWDLKGLRDAVWKIFEIKIDIRELETLGRVEEIEEYIFKEIEWLIRFKDKEIGRDVLPFFIFELIEKYCENKEEPSTWNLDNLWDELQQRVEVKIEKPPEEILRNYLSLFSYLWKEGIERIKERDSKFHPLKLKEELQRLIEEYCKSEEPEKWDLDSLLEEVKREYKLPIKNLTLTDLKDELRRIITEKVGERVAQLEVSKIGGLISKYCPGDDPQKWELPSLISDIENYTGEQLDQEDYSNIKTREELLNNIVKDIKLSFEKKFAPIIKNGVYSVCRLELPTTEWKLEEIKKGLSHLAELTLNDIALPTLKEILKRRLLEGADKIVRTRQKVLTPELFLRVFRDYYLIEIDKQWIEHLENMEHLRQGIYLRGYAQKDPKREYQLEGFEMFKEMFLNIQNNVAEKVFHVRFETEEDVEKVGRKKKERKMILGRGGERPQGSKPITIRRTKPKIGRNDPCPCGSGKKYKKCCMLKDQTEVSR